MREKKEDAVLGIYKLLNDKDIVKHIPNVQLGIVVSVSPLQIEINQTGYFKQNLLINETLMKHERKANVTEIGAATISYESVFKRGDKLACVFDISKQMIFVLCKVV